jgi:hypothetical protein
MIQESCFVYFSAHVGAVEYVLCVVSARFAVCCVWVRIGLYFLQWDLLLCMYRYLFNVSSLAWAKIFFLKKRQKSYHFQ